MKTRTIKISVEAHALARSLVTTLHRRGLDALPSGVSLPHDRRISIGAVVELGLKHLALRAKR